MKNIVLTGFMGTGKSEVGRILSKILSYIFVDSDNEIEKEQKISITEIFRNYGEPRFRDIESDIIQRLSERENLVISTGGGVVLRARNMQNLRRKGIIVCLTASPETIWQRTAQSNERPLLQVEDQLQRIKELLEFREPFYKDADIIVNTDKKTSEEVALEILEKLRHLKL